MLLFANPHSQQGRTHHTIQVSFDDGKTWLANALPVAGPDGESYARVVLLRDITHVQELNEMKNAFVNAVAHDLRVPLTYMGGFISMLPMVGDLNEKQQEYGDRIKAGIDQMTELIERLLNLGRIEAGAPLILVERNVQVSVGK